MYTVTHTADEEIVHIHSRERRQLNTTELNELMFISGKGYVPNPRIRVVKDYVLSSEPVVLN